MPAAKYSALIDSKIARLQNDLEHIKALVEDGTLPRLRLTQAQEQLTDAQDEGILAGTLYGPTPMDRFTDAQAISMLAAAHRRVDRQQSLVDERRDLLDKGVIARADLESVTAELASRQQALKLAENRLKLLSELKQMAETEKHAEKAGALAAGTLSSAMIRFEGNGLFTLADLPAIATQYERRFHHTLPVSALGQTQLHQSLGLDHRNRVDVALNPLSGEGLWLRNFLEKLRVPYLAFRSAIAGAATAPHIHIGLESTRLKIAGR